jgi:hypothetical protein
MAECLCFSCLTNRLRLALHSATFCMNLITMAALDSDGSGPQDSIDRETSCSTLCGTYGFPQAKAIDPPIRD